MVATILARQSHTRVRQGCWQRVWRYFGRLPGRAHYRSALSKVLVLRELYATETDSVHSLKYHRLHPEYVHQRIERLGTSYNLRILLIVCDVVGLVCDI